ncbi:YqaE/Pmp3 family membrane protein [Crocinitomix sp.]|nr:YqaE/Pmp3 family membrane protein [Crocinitomix sp.]
MVSCSTSNEVASNRSIQKRKYTKGYFFDFNKKLREARGTDLVVENIPDDALPVVDENSDKRPISNETVSIEQEVEKSEINYLNTPGQDLSERKTNQTNELAEKDTKSIDGKVKYSSEDGKGEKELTNINEGPIKNSVKQRIVTKKIKQNSGSSEVELILLVILALLLPWLAVGLYTGWDITYTLIAVLLWLLFWLPGIIFAFLVIFDVI